MKCPKCGANTQARAKFCSQCGALLSPQTTFNISSLQNEDIFEPPTLESVLSQTEPYERRVVTVLFADIVGSTTIAEYLDPEELTEIMRLAYPCFFEPIHQHGGSIVQVMGDGVLAYFGAPLALEDDPERAVLAGLDIVSRVQQYATELRQTKGVDEFQVRVGINTGLVVVGEMNPEKLLEYIALGDAVNLAARMQQNAPGNGVLISHATYQQVRGLFDVQEQQPFKVKGREQVEQTYLVLGRKPDHLRSKKRGLEGAATMMVGREPEMAVLRNVYKDVFQGGETTLAFVAGEPGIGKTRLVTEFTNWVTTQNFLPILLRGRAISETQDVPYGVLRNLFARAFGIFGTDSSDVALEKFRNGTHDYLETEQADLIGQFVGFDFKHSPSIQKLFGSASFSEISKLYLKNYLSMLAEKGLLIIIEDIHWVDIQTLDLLSEILIEFGENPKDRMMILCTGRPKFFEMHPNWEEGIKSVKKVNLRKLSNLQCRELIDEILNVSEDIPEAFYQCVVEEAGGNPLFIEEMIRMFIDEGVIEEESGSLSIKLDQLADLHVPSTLNGILQARLDSLPLTERNVLQRAAINGRTFWDGIIKDLTVDQVEKGMIDESLNTLCDRELIYKLDRSSIAGNQEFQFKHALLRDESYETVLLKHRRKYHRQVAIWIEQHAGDRLEEHLTLIANHYKRSGEKGLAADWFIKAGERALAKSSMYEAMDVFGKALDLIKMDDLPRLWKATLGHDEAVGALGELDARHADDSTLLNLAKHLENEGFLAQAYYRIGSQAYSEGNNSDALHAFDLALEHAEHSGDLVLQAEVLPMKIVVLTLEGDLETAGAQVEKALATARQIERPDILARVLTNIALYYEVVGDIMQSMQLMQEQIDINQGQGNLLGETFGLINLGYFYLSLGHFQKSHEILTRALANAEKLGARNCIAYSMLNLGLAEWRLGRTKQACEILDKSLEVLTTIGDQRGLAAREFYLGLSYESGNDINQAADYFRKALECFSDLGDTSGTIETKAGLARLALERGALQEAEGFANKVIHALDKEGPQGLELPILIYFSCFKVFDASGDTKMVDHVRKGAWEEIQTRLSMIHDAEWKEIFLEAVPENRELLALIKEVAE